MITEATPMTTPISVRIERSLLPQSDCSASLKASISFIIQLSWKRAWGNGLGKSSGAEPADRPRMGLLDLFQFNETSTPLLPVSGMHCSGTACGVLRPVRCGSARPFHWTYGFGVQSAIPASGAASVTFSYARPGSLVPVARKPMKKRRAGVGRPGEREARGTQEAVSCAPMRADAGEGWGDG